MRATLGAFTLVGGSLLTGCIVDKVRSRAANDFGCDEDSVQVVRLGAGGWRASGCHQFATYVCVDGICVQNGPRSGDAAPSPPPPPVAQEPPAKGKSEGATAKPTEGATVSHDGVAFELPAGFWRDEDAKGEVYRDGKRHHAARLTVAKSSESEGEWIAAHHPSAKTWTAKVGDHTLTFATRVGSSLRITVAVIASGGKIYELACSSDDVETEKTDAVCTKILGSLHLEPTNAGLPGE